MDFLDGTDDGIDQDRNQEGEFGHPKILVSDISVTIDVKVDDKE